MNKDAYYFPHFSNARTDRKLRRVRKELGIEGYGIYFMTLEVLREQEDFAYPLSDIDLLADDFHASEAKVKAVIMSYDLFSVGSDNFFYSPKLIEYLKPYLDRSKRAREAALKRWHGDLDANALPEHSSSNAIKREESKREESKVEKESESQTCYSFDDFWDDYDHKKDRKKSERKWKNISEIDRKKIKEFIPVYKAHQPDSQYRKYPTTFLNSEIWNDDWSAYPPKQERNQSRNGNHQARTKGDEHVAFLTRNDR